MAMWTGINLGYQAHKASVLAEKNLQLSEDELDIRRRNSDRADKEFESNETLKKVEMAKLIKSTFGSSFSPVKTGSGSGGSSTTNISTEILRKNMAVLTTRFQIPAAEVQDLYAKGGASAVVELAKMGNGYLDKFKTGNYIGEAPSIVVGQMLSDAIFTQSEEVAYDWDKINEQVGFEVDETVRTMVGSSSLVPGTASFESPALIEKPTLAELDAADKRGVVNVEAQSRADAKAINGRLNAIRTRQQSSELSSIENLELQWLVERQGQISSAQESFKDDLFTPLIELYGSSYLETVTEFYPELQNAPLNPAFKLASQQPVDVQSEELYVQLYRSGIIKNGQIVQYINSAGEVVEEIVGQ
jgi:hypothetical protein